MEIEISKNTLITAVLLVALGFSLCVGLITSPRDEDGRPLVLSPSNLAVLRYLNKTETWLGQLEEIGDDVTLVVSDKSNIYNQGRDAEKAFSRAADVFDSIERTKTPRSLIGLSGAIGETAATYLEASRLALIYVGAPTEENKTAVIDMLDEADTALDESRTLREETWPLRSRQQSQ